MPLRLQVVWRSFGRAVGGWQGAVVFGLAAGATGDLVVSNVPWLLESEGRIADGLKLQRPRVPPDKSLVVVLAEDQEQTAKGYLRFVKRLTGRARPSVLLLDWLYSEPRQSDKEVRQVLAAADFPVVLPVADGAIKRDDEAIGQFSRQFRPSLVNVPPLPNVHPAYVSTFRPDAFDVGFIPFGLGLHPDSLVPAPPGRPLLYASMLAVCLATHCDPGSAQLSSDGHRLSIGHYEIPLGENYEVEARWTRSSNPFRTLSVAQSLAALDSGAQDLFRDKIVVVGDGRPDLDLATQTQPYGPLHGSVYLAHMANTLLLPPGYHGRRPDPAALLMTTMAICLAGSFALWRLPSWWKAGGLLASLGLALGAPVLLMRLGNVQIDTLPATLGVLLVGLVFGLVQAGLAVLPDTRVEGARIQATVLFADLVDSTGLSRTLGAVRYQELFGDLVRQADPIVSNHGGEIERTTGDGWLAVFRSPGAETPARALACAEQLQRLPALSRTNGEAQLRLRMGLETGVVSGGFVKEARREAWSSSGPTIVMAQRLLSACEELDRPICVGPVAAALLAEHATLEKAGSFVPKGFEDPVEVFAPPAEAPA